MAASPILPTSRFRLGTLLALLLGAWWLMAPTQAQAQSCWVGSGPVIAFGEVGTAGKDTSDNLTFTCQRSFLQPAAFRVCLSLPGGSPIAGVNPRWMTNNNGAQMAYNLYSDSARSQIIGPFGSGFPAYSTTLVLANFGTLEGNGIFQIYARAFAGQSLPATHAFQAQINGGQLRYSYNLGSFLAPPPTPPTLAQCLSGNGASGSGIVNGIYTGVSATFANTCQIATATDLDFGSTSVLIGNRDRTSTIEFRCPTGTAWRVGLDNGSHPNGTTRRMASAAGNHIQYELYRDNSRTQRWGNTVGTDTSNGNGTNVVQSLTVYGRVPVQPLAAPGAYSDTVTVTLTY